MTRYLFGLTTGFLICAVTLAAEPSAPKEPSSPAKEVPSAGGTSPQDVFEIFRKAVIADDWTTALAQFDEPSRQFLIAGMASTSMTGALGDQGKEVVKNHLTDEDKFKSRMSEINKLPRKEQNTAARSLAEFIKDAPELCQKITALTRERKIENWILELDKVKLELLNEDAESAQGTMRVITVKRNSSEPMNFRKINGRWYLNYKG